VHVNLFSINSIIGPDSQYVRYEDISMIFIWLSTTIYTKHFVPYSFLKTTVDTTNI